MENLGSVIFEKPQSLEMLIDNTPRRFHIPPHNVFLSVCMLEVMVQLQKTSIYTYECWHAKKSLKLKSKHSNRKYQSRIQKSMKDISIYRSIFLVVLQVNNVEILISINTLKILLLFYFVCNLLHFLASQIAHFTSAQAMDVDEISNKQNAPFKKSIQQANITTDDTTIPLRAVNAQFCACVRAN